MIKSNADRVCSWLAIDFDPIAGCEVKMAGAVEAVQSRLKAPHWGIGPGKYVFRDTVQRLLFVVEFRRILLQTLGLGVWQKNLDEYSSIVSNCLQKLGIDQVKRVGFQTQAYLPTGMSHREMADLMFGSFLAPASDLQEVCGKPQDVLVQLHGEQGGMKVQLVVAPMTVEQASQQFMLTPNLEAFLEPKLLDPGAKEFRDRIAVECLYVTADLSRTELPAAEVRLFVRQSLDGADKITEAAVHKLKSLRVKRGH